MQPIFDVTRHFAVFYDEAGNYHGKKRVSKDTVNFKYSGRSYVFRPLHSSYFKNWNVLWNTKYYTYNLENPEPLIIKQNYQPFMTASQYGILIETNALQKLNDLAKKSWLAELLTPRNLIIGAILLGFLWYLNSNGGKLW